MKLQIESFIDYDLQLEDSLIVQESPKDHHWIRNKIEGRFVVLSLNTCPVISVFLPTSNSCHSMFQAFLKEMKRI